MIQELKKENEVLKQKVNKDVAREVVELKESLEKSQHKIQELEREKQSQAAELQKYSDRSKQEIEALKQKVNEDMKQQVAERLRQQEEERVSLLHYVHGFPIKLMITNFAERKSSNRVWYSPPFYTHPQKYKLRLTVHAC